MVNSRTGPDFLDQKPKKQKKDTLIAHARPDGKPHSGGSDHDFMHGRRGSGTYGDGTSKTSKKYNQGGQRTFGDGTPVTSKNYAAFKKNPDAAPKKKKKK